MKNAAFAPHRRFALLLALVAAMSWALPAAAAAAKLPDLASVLGELRKGGYVIYFRHAPTDVEGPGDEGADMARCETQRNLTAEGRRQSTQTGEAFRALRIPVGTVVTSPVCRCKDTAQLAFGRFTVSDEIYVSVGADGAETRRLTNALRRMLSTRPAKGTNAVIVSHMSNLHEAAGIWPKPEGVAYVFRPLSNGDFEAIAMVAPEDWVKVAALRSPGKPR
jgi:phosphohistidine phosphatase SixA